jgi:hypothetical protein
MTFNQRLDEAFNIPTLAEMLNTRGVKPDPCDFREKQQPAASPDTLDDTDEFQSSSGCKKFKGNTILRDREGQDITDSIEKGFQDRMSIWVDYSPKWVEHRDFEEFEGQLSTRPRQVGPECVVWLDAAWGHGNFYKLAWYHPDKGMWIDDIRSLTSV